MDRIGPFVYARHAPRLPALTDGRDRRRHRVAICGGGPVGMAIALGLARWGIASVLIEADDSVCLGSRAACISRRSLEIVERLGVLPAFLAKGLPWTSGRSFYHTDEVFRFTMSHDATRKLPPMINLQQYYIEQILYDALCAHGELVDFRWASEVESLTTRDDGVTLGVRNALGAYTLDTDWLVACDGGQSFTRKQLGLKLDGTAYDGKYVIVDIEMDSPEPAERRAWFDPPSNPGWTMLMHRQPDNLWRIDYQVPDDTDMDAAIRPEAVTPMVKAQLAMVGEAHRPWKLVWTSAYRAGAMTLASYRHGRVLFAGNAAHVMPIFGVRGLNSGFDDADNLIWKLAAVLQRWGGDALLDSYSHERVAAFHINAAAARRSTEFMAPPSRGFSLMREAVLSLAGARPDIAALVNPRQTHAVAYADSALSSSSDAFDGGPAPGNVPDDAPLHATAGGPFLTDATGRHFTLLHFAHAGDAPMARVDSVVPLRMVTVAADANPDLCRTLQAHDGDAYLLRPDGHVCARWHGLRANALEAALQRATAMPAHATAFAD